MELEAELIILWTMEQWWLPVSCSTINDHP